MRRELRILLVGAPVAVAGRQLRAQQPGHRAARLTTCSALTYIHTEPPPPSPPPPASPPAPTPSAQTHPTGRSTLIGGLSVGCLVNCHLNYSRMARVICLLPVLLVGCLLAVLADAAPAAPASHSIQKRQGTTVSKFYPSTGTSVPVLLLIIHICVSLQNAERKRWMSDLF